MALNDDDDCDESNNSFEYAYDNYGYGSNYDDVNINDFSDESGNDKYQESKNVKAKKCNEKKWLARGQPPKEQKKAGQSKYCKLYRHKCA